MAESVNRDLADEVLTVHLRVARVGAATRQSALRVLALLEQDLAEAIMAADPTAPGLLRARQLILRQLRDEDFRPLIQTRYAAMTQLAEDATARLVVFEAQQTAALLSAVITIDIERQAEAEAGLLRQAREALIPAVTTTQELSATASTWWTRQAVNLEQRLFDQINVGIVQGEPVADLVRRVRGTKAQGYTDGVMELSRRDATRLVRTQLASVENTAQLAIYDAHAESLEAVLWLSTLDSRTSLICIARSGLRYTVPEHEPIGHDVVFLGGPPAHWLCRSVLIPVVAGGGRVLDETFSQFLARRGPAFQDELLGPARARMYRSGALSSLKMLLDAATGRPLTLDELGA
jgi:hypothetical protein